MNRRTVVLMSVVLALVAPEAMSVSAGPTGPDLLTAKIISARVVDAKGVGVPKVLVEGFLYVDQEIELKPGEIVPQVKVAETWTDSNGNFTLLVKSTAAQGEIAEEASLMGGNAQFEVRLLGQDGLYSSIEVPREVLPADDSSLARSKRITLSRGLMRTPMNGYRVILHRRKGTAIRLHESVTASIRRAAAVAPMSRTSSLDEAIPSGCNWFHDSNLSGEYGDVAVIHHLRNPIEANYTYETGTDSEFGFALRNPPLAWGLGSGTFSTGGSASSSSASHLRRLDGTDASAAVVQAKYNRVQEYHACAGPPPGPNRWRRRATNWNGMDLRYSSHFEHSMDGNCDSSPHKHLFPVSVESWDKSSAVGKWIGGALSLGVLDVGGRSGWTNRVTTRFFFNSQRKLCGDSAPPVNAHEVFAGG